MDVDQGPALGSTDGQRRVLRTGRVARGPIELGSGHVLTEAAPGCSRPGDEICNGCAGAELELPSHSSSTCPYPCRSFTRGNHIGAARRSAKPVAVAAR